MTPCHLRHFAYEDNAADDTVWSVFVLTLVTNASCHSPCGTIFSSYGEPRTSTPLFPGMKFAAPQDNGWFRAAPVCCQSIHVGLQTPFHFRVRTQAHLL